MTASVRLLQEPEVALEFDLEPSARHWQEVTRGSEQPVFCSEGYRLELHAQRQADTTIWGFRLRRDNGDAFQVNHYALKAAVPLIDIHRLWQHNFVWHGATGAICFPRRFIDRAAANVGTPFLLFASRAGLSRFAIGFGNQTLETQLQGNTGWRDGISRVALTRPYPASVRLTRSVLEDSVFLSWRGQYWFDTAKEYERYVDELLGYQPNPIPPRAYEPVWCSWYAFDDDIAEECIWENAQRAKDAGIGTILIDAGWNTESGGLWAQVDGPYGDYVPMERKFPDLKGLVARMQQELGLAVEFWLSLFWIGSTSQAYQKVGQARIVTREGPNINLCPRHPATRDHVAEVAGRVVREFGLDGVWIDFMDGIPVECIAEHPHVYETMSEGYAECIKAIHAAIIASNPQAIIELRLAHANLHNKRYANVYETTDDPLDFDVNRRMGVIVRTLSRGLVPKTDPTIWHLAEWDKNVAKHMASMVMGGVPAISVDFSKLPDSHLQVVKAWLSFYHAHKGALHSGQFRPLGFDPRFPHVMVSAGRETFIHLGCDAVPAIALPNPPERLYLMNATDSDRIRVLLEGVRPGHYKASLYNPFLEEVDNLAVQVGKEGLLELAAAVPEGGMAILRMTA